MSRFPDKDPTSYGTVPDDGDHGIFNGEGMGGSFSGDYGSGEDA